MEMCDHAEMQWKQKVCEPVNVRGLGTDEWEKWCAREKRVFSCEKECKVRERKDKALRVVCRHVFGGGDKRNLVCAECRWSGF